MNQNKPPKTEKQKLFTAFCTFGTIFLILFCISNQSSLMQWVGKWISILNPVIIGFIIAYLCNPIYRKIREKAPARIKRPHLRKALALILTYLIVITFVGVLIVIIVPQVVSSYKDLESKFETYLNAAIAWANNFVLNSPLFDGQYTDIFDFLDANNVAQHITDFIAGSGALMQTAVTYVFKYGSNFILGLKDFFVGVFISIYVLLFKEHLSNITKRFIRSVTSRERYDSILRRASHTNGKIGGYIIGAITDSIIVAIEGLIIFSIFGIPYAPLIAIIVGVTNIIPIFGPFLGAFPSAFIIFIANPSKVILFIILIIVIQQIDGNIVAPYILGSKTGLTSLGIIIAITVTGGYFGILGMFIGVPLFAVIYDVINEGTNARLKEIDDPEFPPEEDTEEKKKTENRFLIWLKKTAVALWHALVRAAKFVYSHAKTLLCRLREKMKKKK